MTELINEMLFYNADKLNIYTKFDNFTLFFISKYANKV